MSKPECSCAACGARLEFKRIDGRWVLVELDSGDDVDHMTRCPGRPR